MKNAEIAELLYKIADLMEIKGETGFKVIAYRRAAQTIESMPKDIEDIWKTGKLDDIPGVGRGIAERIDEYLGTGKSGYLDELKKKLPAGIEKLLDLEGIGPKKVKLLYAKLKIKTIEDLEQAAKQGKIRKIATLGEKTEENILRSIEISRKRAGRALLGYALAAAEDIIDEMKKKSDVKKINVAGSIRRGKETIGDIDILVTSSEPKKVIDYFTKMKGVSDVIGKGPTKASVHLDSGMQVDLRVLKDDKYGSALMYFTGSKEHNVELRRIAISRGMKLSEYGLFRGRKMIAGKTEESVYTKLGMDYIEPEMRESRGEIEAAAKGKLPDLVRLKDVKGDFHTHSKWSDGANTIEEMAAAAKNLGYDYICISDHAGRLAIANPMNEKKIEQRSREIEALNKKIAGITILQGAEIDILADGKLSMPDKILKELDVVLASIHSAFRAGKERNTARIIGAMENKHVDIIAHLSGRLIDKREGADMDMEKVTDKAKETNTILEVNSQPERMDINDAGIISSLAKGVKISIDTDAHSTEQLRYMSTGIKTARRGWATKRDVINTNKLDKMRKMLK